MIGRRIPCLAHVGGRARAAISDRTRTALAALIRGHDRTTPIELLAWSDALVRLETRFSWELDRFLREPAARTIEWQMRSRLLAVGSASPAFDDGDAEIAFTAYAICRAIHPSAVVQLGVRGPFVAAFILKAMAVNRSGALHTIGRTADRAWVGQAVPEPLRGRWTPHGRDDRATIAGVLGATGRADLVIHDTGSSSSVHSHLPEVGTAVRPGGVLVVRQPRWRRGFQRWVATRENKWSCLVQLPAGDAVLGIAVV